MNPDRISLPDIDVDFDDDGRGEVLNWVTNKIRSGKSSAHHYIWYDGNQASDQGRGARTETAFERIGPSGKLVPDKIPDKKLNLPNAIAYVPELQAAEASPDPLVRDTMKYAKMLEGNVRGTVCMPAVRLSAVMTLPIGYP